MQNYVDEMIDKNSIKKEQRGGNDVTAKQADPLKPYSDSQELETVNNKDMGEMIEELRLCLPVWVTRDQMLHLLTKSRGDIVAATSELYERETEFYEQVLARDTKINTIATTTTYDCVVPPKPPVRDTGHQSLTPACDTKSKTLVATMKHDCAVSPKLPVRDAGHQSLLNVQSMDKKLPSLTHSSKAPVPSKKRGSVPGQKSKKKVKTSSATDKQAAITMFFKKQDSAPAPSGPLQTAITKFFKKSVPDNPQASEGNDATKPYKNV